MRWPNHLRVVTTSSVDLPVFDSAPGIMLQQSFDALTVRGWWFEGGYAFELQYDEQM